MMPPSEPDAARMTSLQERLQKPAENWVDVLMIALLTDPTYYVGAAVAVFVVLAVVALWAAKTLLDAMDAEERPKKEAERKKTKRKMKKEEEGAAIRDGLGGGATSTTHADKKRQ